MIRSVRARSEEWPISGQFTISRNTKRSARVVVVEIQDDDELGRGESVPYGRYGESVESVLSSIRDAGHLVGEGATRDELRWILPAGAARNAVDSALWDLEAKISGRRAWALAGLVAPVPVTTAYTLSLDDPEIMGDAARRNAEAPILKLKLGDAAQDLRRVEAVAENAPSATLIVDVNEGWTVEEYLDLSPKLRDLGVAMIEQPLPAADDHLLDSLERPVRLCADESVHDRPTLEPIIGRYDAVNVKLDKTGGLTEALELVRAAAKCGLELFVGSMVATSLGVAPATLLTPFADCADLDGPLLLESDRPHGLTYEDYVVGPPSRHLWG